MPSQRDGLQPELSQRSILVLFLERKSEPENEGEYEDEEGSAAVPKDRKHLSL